MEPLKGHNGQKCGRPNCFVCNDFKWPEDMSAPKKVVEDFEPADHKCEESLACCTATPEWNKVEGFKGKIDGGAVKDVMFNPKLSLELISPVFLTAIARVLGHGAKKYSSSNWMRGMSYTVVLGSILRHLFLWAAGVEIDADSGFPHLNCAACGLMFLIHFIEKDGDYKQFDDRVFNQ